MVEGLKGSPIPQPPAKGRKPAEAAAPERGPGAPQGPQVVSPRARVDGPAAAAGSSPSGSSTTGSSPAFSFRGLVRDLAKSPPVDASRVTALRASIAAGRYASDPQAIAEAMLMTEAMLQAERR